MQDEATDFKEVLNLGWPVGIGSGQWQVLKLDGSPTPLNQSPIQGLVTILQRHPETFLNGLKGQLNEAGLDQSWADCFPIDAAIRLGLTWGSDFWESHALSWVDALDLIIQLQDELEHIAKNGRTQRNRHLARHLIQRSRGRS